jgi:hypothetical protein
MSYTQIRARVIDQTLQLTHTPKLASGGVNAVQIVFDFCSLWNGYGKIAVFYREEDEDQVYHIPVADGVATVPHEVLADEGCFFFGVMGTADNTRTTEVLQVFVTQGAITSATAEHKDPTPDIYQQLLAAYGHLERSVAVERERINELLALRSANGIFSYTHTEGPASLALKSNGFYARINCDIASATLAAGEFIDINIPDEFAPFAFLTAANNTSVVPNEKLGCVIVSRDDMPAFIRIQNTSSTSVTATQYFEAYYALKNVVITELTDMRVAFDGEPAHPTASDAVRAQYNKLATATKAEIENGVLIVTREV